MATNKTRVKSFIRKGKRIKTHIRKQEPAKEGSWAAGAIILGASGTLLALKNRKQIRNYINKKRFEKFKKRAAKSLPGKKLGVGEYGRVDSVANNVASKHINLRTNITSGSKKIRDLGREYKNLKIAAKSGATPKPIKNYGGVITMEKIQGDTLYDLIDNKLKTNSLTDSDLDNLAKETARSLKDFHKTGLIHNDLHGNNLIVDKKGKVKIIDLGLSKKEKFKTSSKELAAKITDIDRLATKGLFNPKTPGSKEARSKYRAKLKNYYFDPSFSTKLKKIIEFKN